VDISTVAEFVPGYDANSWYGIGAPRNTPAAVIEKLSTQINAVLSDPEMQTRLADLGAEPMPMMPGFRRPAYGTSRCDGSPEPTCRRSFLSGCSYGNSVNG
jgi:hypothetical protein